MAHDHDHDDEHSELSDMELHVRALLLPPDAAADRDTIVRTVTAAIERLMPGFSGRIASVDLLSSPESDPPSVARLVASADRRYH